MLKPLLIDFNSDGSWVDKRFLFHFHYLNYIEFLAWVVDQTDKCRVKFSFCCQLTSFIALAMEIQKEMYLYKGLLKTYWIFSPCSLICSHQFETAWEIYWFTEAEFHSSSCEVNILFCYEEHQTNFETSNCRHLLNVDLRSMHPASRQSMAFILPYVPSHSYTGAAHFPLKQIVWLKRWLYRA